MIEIIKINILDLKQRFSKSEFPCLEYCKELIKEGAKPSSKLEVWNYSREKPEADWIVENIGEYVKNEKEIKKHRIRNPRLRIEGV